MPWTDANLCRCDVYNETVGLVCKAALFLAQRAAARSSASFPQPTQIRPAERMRERVLTAPNGPHYLGLCALQAIPTSPNPTVSKRHQCRVGPVRCYCTWLLHPRRSMAREGDRRRRGGEKDALNLHM